MTKRRLLRWSLLLVILAAFAVWLEPTRVVWGWLRGEAFYQGRPTSYWELALGPWEHVRIQGPEFYAECLRYRPVPMTRFMRQVFHLPDPPMAPAILQGDLEAEAVLLELAESSSDKVRALARYGLDAMRNQHP